MIPRLETERLVLRELRPSDAPALYRFRGDADAQKHNDPHLTSPDQADALIARLADDHDATGSVHWGLTLRGDDTVVGLPGFHHVTREAHRAGLGYDLARHLWGRGIMSEALRAVLAWGFDALALNKIEAHTDAENTASTAMLERLGFRLEGTLHDHFHEDGAFHDVSLYALLRRDRGLPPLSGG